MIDNDRDLVRRYYAEFGEREWSRLERPDDGAVEYRVTTAALERYLPATGRVLDIGGGPGRYAVWLAERGYTVSLADLSPELLAIARSRIAEAGVGDAVSEIAEADACHLARWPDGGFDATLSLGPFYHLTDPADRDQAAGELARVVRPGGIAFVAVMPRITFLRRTLALPDERHHLLDPDWVRRLLDDGVFVNDIPGRFSVGYGVRPGEVESLFGAHGFDRVAVLSAESISAGIADAFGELIREGGPAAEAATRLAVDLAGDEAVLGGAIHVLFVGRRR